MKFFIYIVLVLNIIIIVSCKKTKANGLTDPTTSVSSYKDSTKSSINIDNSIDSESIEEKDILPVEKEDSILYKKEVKNEISQINKDKDTKYHIFLSLDDGPQEGTRNCWNILKEYNVPATFFMIGVHNEGKGRQSLVDSIHNDPLFVIGNHSNTHAYYNKYGSFYKDPSGSLNDFLLAEKKLNIKNKIARLPGRNTWSINHVIKGEISAKNTVKKLDSIGYSVFGWDAEWHFTHGSNPVQSADEMVKIVENTLQNGKTHVPNSIVILVHDRMFHKPEHAASFKKFIATLKQNDNYIFDTLNNYPL